MDTGGGAKEELAKEITKKILSFLPVLDSIPDKENKDFKLLIKLIYEMSNIDYSLYKSSQKYKLTFNIIKIGNLMELLLPKEIQEGVSVKTLKDILAVTMVNELKDVKQQYSLFKTARNMASNTFHYMQEDDIKIILINFTNLCKGGNVANYFASIQEIHHRQEASTKKKNFIISLNPDHQEALEKLFNQVAYFLDKSDMFISFLDLDGAAMALIAAAKCLRDFMRSKADSSKSAPIVSDLAALSEQIAHLYIKINEATLHDKIRTEFSKDQIVNYISSLKKQVEVFKVKVDLKSYLEKESKLRPGSPRAYSQEDLEKMKKTQDSKEESEEKPITLDIPRGSEVSSRGRGRGVVLESSPKPRETSSSRDRGSYRASSEGRGIRREITSQEKTQERKDSKKESKPRFSSSHEEEKIKPFRKDDRDKGGGSGHSKDTKFSAPSTGNLGSGNKETKAPSQPQGSNTTEHKTSTASEVIKEIPKEQKLQSSMLTQQYNRSVNKNKTWKTREEKTKNVALPSPFPTDNSRDSVPEKPEIRLKKLTPEKQETKASNSSEEKGKEVTHIKSHI